MIVDDIREIWFDERWKALWWIFIRSGNYYTARAQWSSQHKWETGNEWRATKRCCSMKKSNLLWRIGCHFNTNDVENQFHWWSKVHSFQSSQKQLIEFSFRKYALTALVRCHRFRCDIIIMHEHGSTRSNQHPWLLTNRNYDYITHFKMSK